MAKNSRKQIEKDKRKIIGELLKNSNKSINEIAKTCGFSRQKVWRIIKDLEKNQTIWGYTAVVDEEKLDKKSYMALIKRNNEPVSKKLVDDIIGRKMEKKANEIDVTITESLYTHGIYDYILCFEARNIRDAKKFCESVNRQFKGFIKEIHLLDGMFSVKKFGIENPEVEDLKNFFDLKE